MLCSLDSENFTSHGKELLVSGWKKNPDYDSEGRIFLPCCEFNYVPISSNCPLPTNLRGVTLQHKHTKERNREREKYMHKLHLTKKDMPVLLCCLQQKEEEIGWKS
jgi:hypothetical protein